MLVVQLSSYHCAILLLRCLLNPFLPSYRYKLLVHPDFGEYLRHLLRDVQMPFMDLLDINTSAFIVQTSVPSITSPISTFSMPATSSGVACKPAIPPILAPPKTSCNLPTPASTKSLLQYLPVCQPRDVILTDSTYAFTTLLPTTPRTVFHCALVGA